MAFFALEKLHQLHDGYRRAFNVNGQPLLLIQDQGRLHLILNQCPHMNAPLTHATLRDGKLRCPMHGIEFDLARGYASNAAVKNLTHLRLVYEGNQVGIDV